ncbi:unnamed protein product [Sphagnum troendelagicum]|uniref:Uncharacterized protein n=1 Tax=Sphagnum troendelagicum TaxID=128251 RepID=A0ABP0V3B2_9BRYO
MASSYLHPPPSGARESSEKNPLMQAPYSKIIRLLMTTLHKCLLCGQIRVSHTYIKSLFTGKMMWCISCNSFIPDVGVISKLC